MKKILFLCGIISLAAANAQQRDLAVDTLLKIADSTALQAKIAVLEKGSEKALTTH